MGASKKAECCLNTTNSVPFVRSECEKRKATLEPALTKLRLPTRLISISKYWALPNSCQATIISSLSRNSPAKTSLTDSSTSETLLRSLKRNNSRSYSTTLSKNSQESQVGPDRHCQHCQQVFCGGKETWWSSWRSWLFRSFSSGTLRTV